MVGDNGGFQSYVNRWGQGAGSTGRRLSTHQRAAIARMLPQMQYLDRFARGYRRSYYNKVLRQVFGSVPYYPDRVLDTAVSDLRAAIGG